MFVHNVRSLISVAYESGRTKILQLLRMRSYNRHYIMPKWGIFNASLLHNEHGHSLFYFNMINIQWTNFGQKSIVNSTIIEQLSEISQLSRIPKEDTRDDWPNIAFELFFVKKIPLSRRVEYVMDGSMDE